VYENNVNNLIFFKFNRSATKVLFNLYLLSNQGHKSVKQEQ